MREGDFLYVSAQIRDKNEKQILETYSSPECWRVAYTQLKQIGFSKDDFEYSPLFIGDAVEMSSFIKSVPEQLSHLGMKPGERIVTHRSRKPTLSEFRECLSKHFKPRIWSDKERGYAIAVCRKT
jgi:uncharacterized SAM-dependent methyltransferase